MPVWLRKIVLAQHNSRVRFQWLVKARSNSCATAEKSGINVISLLLSVSDWLIIMIGPSGLLLLVPHLFALPVSILYITKLWCEIYFCSVTYWVPLEMLKDILHHKNTSTISWVSTWVKFIFGLVVNSVFNFLANFCLLAKLFHICHKKKVVLEVSDGQMSNFVILKIAKFLHQVPIDHQQYRRMLKMLSLSYFLKTNCVKLSYAWS